MQKFGKKMWTIDILIIFIRKMKNVLRAFQI